MLEPIGWKVTEAENGQVAVELAHRGAHYPIAAEAEEPLILVVDDDATVRELVVRHLERAGFAVVAARGGQEGLRLARELRPAAVTLDIMMPDLDGWTVLAAIKGDPALASIPVVLVRSSSVRSFAVITTTGISRQSGRP